MIIINNHLSYRVLKLGDYPIINCHQVIIIYNLHVLHKMSILRIQYINNEHRELYIVDAYFILYVITT